MFCAVIGTVRAAFVVARGAVVDGADEDADNDDCKNSGRNAGVVEDRVARGVRVR